MTSSLAPKRSLKSLSKISVQHVLDLSIASKMLAKILSKIPAPQKLKDGASLTGETFQEDVYGIWDELANSIIHQSIDWSSNRLRSDFLRQPSLSAIHNKIRDDGIRIGRYLAASDYGSKLLSLYSDSLFGRPYLIQPEFPCLSSGSIQHLSYLELLHRHLGIDFVNSDKDFHFIEFGGGYGNLARILLEVNDQIRVDILDLPSMLLLQQLFLRTTVAGSVRHQRVRFLQSQHSFYKVVSERAPSSHKHFHATFSIDESPFEVRNDVEQTILPLSDSFFVAYSAKILGFDNLSWVDGFRDRVEKIFSVRSGPLPGMIGFSFLCGLRIQV